MPRSPRESPPLVSRGLQGASVAIPDPPGRLYIPALGRFFQQTTLVPVTYSWALDSEGRLDLPASDAIERVIFSVGAKPGANWQVWCDERLEKGDVTASQLSVRFNGVEYASLALLHLDYFWPQLHRLIPDIRWDRNTMFSVRGPPSTIVTIEGIENRPVTR